MVLAVGGAPGAMAAGSQSTVPLAGVGPAPGTVPVIEPPGLTEVVLFSRQGRTSTVVSKGPGGIAPTASSRRPSVSSDGSFVAFESDAALQNSDTNGQPDVYFWERAFDISTRISLGAGGGEPNGASSDPSISGDGNLVAFASTAYNLTSSPLPKGNRYVYAWDRLAGSVALASAGDQGPGAGSSTAPSISFDGRVIGFESTAENLVADDTNGVRDVFLRDLGRGATIRASVRDVGGEVSAESRRPSVSGDGGAVAFDSLAGGLVAGDTNKLRDVFVRDLPPAVQVLPDPVAFGVVALGTPATETVTVASVGWTPVRMTSSVITGTHAGDFVPGDLCAGQLLPFGATCTIDVTFIPAAPGSRVGTLEISDTATDSPQKVELEGGVPGIELQLDPTVGPAGVVAVLRGTGLPLGARVLLRWDRGITQALPPIDVAADGSFAVGVLVFHNDVGGARQLIVYASPDGAPFEEQALGFLVVPGALQPPGAGAVDFTDPQVGLPVLGR